MKKVKFLLIVTALFFSCQNEHSSLGIMFTGDVILDRGVKDQVTLHGDSLLTKAFYKAKSEDFLIVNYEGTFTNQVASQRDKFNFSQQAKYASLLAKSGVTHVSIANNHSYDYYEEGFKDTVEALSQNNLDVLGNTCNPKILSKGEYNCAILGASLTTHNENLCISSIKKLKSSVINFKKNHPEIPLVLYIHWGLELQYTPEKWQKELAVDLVNLGVDAIIGHHPHVVQTIDFINDVPVFYSLGNYIADAYLPNTNISYTISLKVTDQIDQVNLIPIELKRYFPFHINKDRQLSYLKKYLSFSNGVCALQNKESWILKPLEMVDFKEETTLWVSTKDTIYSTIKKMQSGQKVLTVHTPNSRSNTVGLFGELSEMHFSDIDNNGITDILLGIKKKVHFDQEEKKRLNIYSYKEKRLSPLWLGTKFIDDVDSFSPYTKNRYNYLQTIEVDKKGKKHQRIYKWDDFGFALTNK
ncbi:CapA family protein [Aquimarina sp. AD10]|nr:CapA family protein [Aquimarina sp. AD10]